jgi:hypothetical protein
MDGFETSTRDPSAIVDRYRAIGLYGGLFFGGIVGIVVAGPHFQEWSSARSLLTIAGSLAVGGLVGYLAGEIAIASHVSGSGSGFRRGAGSSDGDDHGGGGDVGGSD